MENEKLSASEPVAATMHLAQAFSVSLLLHAAALNIPDGTLDGAALARTETFESRQPRLAVGIRPSNAVPKKNPAHVAPNESQPESHGALAPLPFGILRSRYYGPLEVSRRAAAIGDVPPLPASLTGGEQSARLVFVLRISDKGQVDTVGVDLSTADEAVTDALVHRFQALRFHPAELDGIAVASRMKIEVLLRAPDV